MDARNATEVALARIRSRAAAWGLVTPLLGALLLGSSLVSLPACDDRGGVEETLEEVQDEAKDLKDEIVDEIDDHTSLARARSGALES